MAPESNHSAGVNSAVLLNHSPIVFFFFFFLFLITVCSVKLWPPGPSSYMGKTISPTCAGHTFGWYAVLGTAACPN